MEAEYGVPTGTPFGKVTNAARPRDRHLMTNGCLKCVHHVISKWMKCQLRLIVPVSVDMIALEMNLSMSRPGYTLEAHNLW
jgi:hypothetical protein